MAARNTIIREARKEDLGTILNLIADDPLGKASNATSAQQGAAIDPCYLAAFDAIEEDPNQQLIVSETDGALSSVLQLSFIPGLTRKGTWRGHIEAVRIANNLRGQGFGRMIMTHAIERARQRGCSLVQLTTDRRALEAAPNRPFPANPLAIGPGRA